MAESKFIDAGGLHIHYLEAGAGVPVILLHGGLATAEMSWNETMPGLAEQYRVLAPDSRGHGKTDNPGGTLSYAQMADDVAAFVYALKLERPLIFGYSDGGQIALEFGLRHPGKARGLVFGGTIIEMADGYVEMLHEWGFPTPGKVDHETLERSFGDFYATITTAHGPHDQPEYYRSLLDAISTLWLTVPAYPADRLARISDPALVICGDRDGAAIAQAFRFFAALPRGELAVVPNAQHEGVARPVFWESVKDFLARNAGP